MASMPEPDITAQLVQLVTASKGLPSSSSSTSSQGYWPPSGGYSDPQYAYSYASQYGYPQAVSVYYNYVEKMGGEGARDWEGWRRRERGEGGERFHCTLTNMPRLLLLATCSPLGPTKHLPRLLSWRTSRTQTLPLTRRWWTESSTSWIRWGEGSLSLLHSQFYYNTCRFYPQYCRYYLHNLTMWDGVILSLKKSIRYSPLPPSSIAVHCRLYKWTLNYCIIFSLCVQPLSCENSWHDLHT